jgi:phosphate-transporting ATPase
MRYDAPSIIPTCGRSALLQIRALAPFGLAPFDLALEKGECVALMGPSGAGKTVTLRAIADLDPNEGQVFLNDRERESFPAPGWRRQVAYVPADSGWWSDLVGDHFESREAAREFLPRFLLSEDALGWEVARLSTGERQRLALARALLLDPAVLLLDEPTPGLDEDAAKAVEGELRDRLRDGACMLMVTHSREQARRLAKRLFMVREGTLREEVP